MDELDRLLTDTTTEHGIGKAVDVSHLIVPKDELLPAPHLRLWGPVNDLVLEARHDTEIVTRAPKSPEKILMFGIRGGDRRAISQNQS